MLRIAGIGLADFSAHSALLAENALTQPSVEPNLAPYEGRGGARHHHAHGGKSPHEYHRALPNTGAFDDGNVAIDGEIREGLDAATRLWPANFQPIDFGSRADAQDLSGVV